ncbi:MAG: hypothetical protein J6A98_01535 [Clostridia bacterium]|nr:hypothetical protein [Clostridia bacterium]
MYEYSSTYPDYYLNFPSEFKEAIQLKTIKNAYYYYTYETVDKYLFAPGLPGYDTDSFSFDSESNNRRIAYQINTNTACDYWAKDSDNGTSGKGTWYTTSGSYTTYYDKVSAQKGVRPTFVLKL